MQLFATNGSKEQAVLITGILGYLGFNYTSKKLDEPPTVFIIDKDYPKQILGQHMDDQALLQFLRNAPADTITYRGDDEVAGFVLEALAQAEPRTTYQQRQAKIMLATAKAMTDFLEIMLGKQQSPITQPAAPAPAPKAKKQAAGFDKTKASKQATKPVRQGKIRIAGKK